MFYQFIIYINSNYTKNYKIENRLLNIFFLPLEQLFFSIAKKN